MKFFEYSYKRPDIGELKNEFSDILHKFSQASKAEEQISLIHAINTLRSHFDTMFQLCTIRHSINTKDEFYLEEQNFFDNNLPVYEGLVHAYYTALCNSAFRGELEIKFGKQLFRIASLSLKTFSPEIIDELVIENILNTEYMNLIASAVIPFEGEDRNLAELGPFMRSTDRNMRRRAAIARWDFMKENEQKLDSIYDSLVKTRTSISVKLGYENFVQLGYDRMLRSDYNPNMVANYRKQILEEVVPVATELRHRQAKRLGYDSLKYYDEPLFFEKGNAKPKGSSEFIIENGRYMYEQLSGETAQFIDFMMDRELMDLVAKKGKATGGYCTYIPAYHSPFIFSNFNGTAADIDVLTHEVGHAFQVYMSRQLLTNEYYWPTSEAAEIHSMSMEYFTYPWMNLFFNGEAEKYKYAHACDSVLFLPYGVAVDEFQHVVYENPELSPKQRKTVWREIEKKYLPHRMYDDNDYLNRGGYWQTQSHIYQSPFYYIDYTLAQICAFQFWKNARIKPEETFTNYVKLCKAGGSKSFIELVNYAQLQSPFEEGCVASVLDDVKIWLNTIDDLSL